MGAGRTVSGVVVSDKMDKTVVVAVEKLRRHLIYRKFMRRTKRYKAHDEGNRCRTGDTVLIAESRPLSKDKRWRVVKILARGAILREPREQAEEPS